MSIHDHDTHHARFAATVAALRDQFGGRAAITPGAALSALPGANPADPSIAAARRRARGTYPFPTRRVGGQLLVLLVDIAAALLDAPAVVGTSAAADDAAPEPAANDDEPEQAATPSAPEPGARRRRGRPRLVARQAGA